MKIYITRDENGVPEVHIADGKAVPRWVEVVNVPDDMQYITLPVIPPLHYSPLVEECNPLEYKTVDFDLWAIKREDEYRRKLYDILTRPPE